MKHNVLMKPMKCQQRELVKQGLLLQDDDIYICSWYIILIYIYIYNLEVANENGTKFLHSNKNLM